MISIAIINRKGGSSKTSTTSHLGGTLARMGKRVLLVDLDPQSSLTQGLLGASSLHALPQEATISSVWGGDAFPERIIHPTSIDRLWLIPGHEDADRWNLPITDERQEMLPLVAEVLREARDDFDYAIMDCPPTLYLCSYAALYAADHVITPTQPEDYGANGLVKVTRAIRSVQSQIGNPSLLGYLLSMVDKRLGIHQAYMRSLRETYGDLVFRTEVPLNAAYKEAVSARQPISHYKPKSVAAKIYVSLAEEIKQRIAVKSEAA